MTTEPRTFVLVHGAFHGGWCWKKVIPLLQAQGHRVYTPTQTGLGERSHLLRPNLGLQTFVDDITNVLLWEDLTDVTLVGHSFGGIIISGVADRMPERIRNLIYLDSLILQDGESAFDKIPVKVAQQRRIAAQEASGGLTLVVPEPAAFGITQATDAAWLKRYCTPHPLSTYDDPMVLSNAPGNGLAATYVAVTPYYEPTTSSRDYAQNRSDWRYLEVPGSHDMMVDNPTGVVDIMLNN